MKSGIDISQHRINRQMARFGKNFNRHCKDPKKHISELILNYLAQKEGGGTCGGLVLYFLACIQSETRIKKFKQILETFSRWSPETKLTDEDSNDLRDFILTIYNYQEADHVAQGRMDRVVYFQEKTEAPFILEHSLCADLNYDQCVDLLNQLEHKDRLIVLSSSDHEIGKFNNVFYNPSLKKGWYFIADNEETAEQLFTQNDLSPEKPSPLAIQIFYAAESPIKKSELVISEILDELKLEYNDDGAYSEGINAIHNSIIIDNPEMLKYHLQHADIKFCNARKKGGDTPLILAIRDNKLSAVLLLLQHGANPFIQCFEGFLPLELAKRSGNLEIAEALLNFTANLSIQDSKSLITAADDEWNLFVKNAHSPSKRKLSVSDDITTRVVIDESSKKPRQHEYKEPKPISTLFLAADDSRVEKNNNSDVKPLSHKP